MLKQIKSILKPLIEADSKFSGKIATNTNQTQKHIYITCALTVALHTFSTSLITMTYGILNKTLQ